MRTYRPGLWFLVGGLVATLCIWAVSTSFWQLQRTGEIEITSLTYFQIIGYADVVATIVLVTGAALAAIGSPSGQRRHLFVAIAALFAAYRILQLAPWLLQSIGGIEVSLETHVRLLQVMSLLYIAAFAALAFIARAGSAGKRFATYSIILIAVRAGWFLVTNALAHDFGGSPADWTSAVSRLLALALLLCATGLVFDMLGAFKDNEQRAPDARLRDRTRGITTYVAIALAFLGIGLAGLAVWGTKRTSSIDWTKLTLLEGTLVFMSAAVALRALQHREVRPERFAVATLVVMIAGRVVLGLYGVSAQNVDLEEHALPGLSIALPEGETDVRYSYIELGRLVVTTRHAGLGLVELSWAPADRDPIVALRTFADREVDVTPFNERGHGIEVQGVVLTYETVVRAYATWKCPGDNHWFTLSVERYSPGADVIRNVTSRIVESVRCGSLAIAEPFKMPPPEQFSSMWALELDPADVLRRAGMTEEAHTTTVSATPIPHGIIEDEERTIYQQLDDTGYHIASVWHCYTLGVDVALYHSGPVPESRKALLDAISGAHCPR